MNRGNTGRSGGAMAIFFLMAALIIAYNSNALAGQPHAFSTGECVLCHGDDGTEVSPSAVIDIGQIHSVCDNCHGACEPWGIHQGRVAAGMKQLEALPAADDGTILCITCHDPHPEDFHRVPYESPNLRIANLKRELCLNCHTDSADRQWRVEIAAPLNGAVVHDRHVPLLGRAEALPEPYLEVRVNGASFPLKVKRGAFHTRLSLQEGVNVVEIRFRDAGLWRGELFLAEGEGGSTRYDRTFYGHQTASMQECLSCHGSEGGVFRTEVRTGSGLCYQCHEEFDGKRYLHGPLAVGECNICHDPHGGVGPNHLKAEETTLCRSCHGDDEVLGHSGGRNALVEGSCSDCHDPHQSDGRFLMKQALL